MPVSGLVRWIASPKPLRTKPVLSERGSLQLVISSLPLRVSVTTSESSSVVLINRLSAYALRDTRWLLIAVPLLNPSMDRIRRFSCAATISPTCRLVPD